jgi:feruloyl-CoA synthase
MSRATREVRLGSADIRVETRGDGSILVRCPQPLGPYPARLTERLEHWAAAAPHRVFIAQRAGYDWRCVTYAEALAAVRALGQALLDRRLSSERPIAILSGNDIEHALLGLAALHVGVPYAPISVAYSQLSADFGKLRYIIDLLTPGLVFAASGSRFAAAIRAVVPDDTEIAVTEDPIDGRRVTAFADLAATTPTEAVDVAAAAVGADTVGKILFTSGSTGQPKGVINTQRMLCSNQRMLHEFFAFAQDEPPVLVDWLPWNHTFGGNHNVGLVLYNGGSLYIDHGKPMPKGIEETVRNLREIAPTIYFNVPKGFEELIPYLRREPTLRRTFFSRLNMMFYAGASLSQHVWDALDSLAVQTTGQRVVMITGLGSTETGPFALATTEATAGAGHVGLPVPGVDLKLIPNAGKLEALIAGPSITPGYWRNEAMTRAVFDEEGFYRLGDALSFIDPAQPLKGFRFNGRIAEDFKLATGTWVNVGTLRLHLITALSPLVRDVVIAGHDRDYVAILALPEDSARDDPRLHAKLRDALTALAQEATGSSTRVLRAVLMDAPLSIDRGEVTDKGSINQRAVIAHRADLVAALYADPPPPHVITIGSPA